MGASRVAAICNPSTPIKHLSADSQGKNRVGVVTTYDSKESTRKRSLASYTTKGGGTASSASSSLSTSSRPPPFSTAIHFTDFPDVPCLANAWRRLHTINHFSET